jgi:hypothetical protein
VRVVAWACAASTVTALMCAAAPNLVLLLVARALSGAAAAAIPDLEAEQLLEQKKAQKLLEQIDDLF